MDRQRSGDSARRFADYLDKLASVMGHAGRVGPMRDYCTGLLLPCERKSVEPIAAATAPERVGAQHQALLHFVAEGMWSDEVVLAKVRDMVLPQIERHGPIEAWILDDTGFPKHGAHSVGVTHQYCGELGKQANCQAAVSLSIANHHASLPVAYRLYLPKSWAQDKKRRTKAGVPDAIAFQTKPKIALDQLARACAADLPRGVVLIEFGLWDGRLLASRQQRAWPRLCGRRLREDVGRRRQRQQGQDDGQGAGPRSASARVENDHVAQRLSRALALALCACTCARPRRGLHAQRARGMAAGRVAKGRDGANQILALFVVEEHRLRPPRRHHHDALAHRAFARWHITSTDIDPASFPLLATVASRRFAAPSRSTASTTSREC